MIFVLGLISLVLVVFATGIATLNLITWPTTRQEGVWGGQVSVLIPARNEEKNIGACIQSVLAQRHAIAEVIVLDDGSTDMTPAIVGRWSQRDARVRLVHGIGLPEGWVGKPHACHLLGRHARGDLLLFVDADVRLEPGAIGRVATLLSRYRSDLLTAVPYQVTGSFVEHLVLPLLHLTYVSWLPLFLVWYAKNSAFVAANGQVLAITKDAYERIGGFASVRNEVVDDMAICRRAKRLGLRVLFCDGLHLAKCRMYQSGEEVWKGFSKNMYEGLGSSPIRLGFVLFVYWFAFILPFVWFIMGLVEPQLLPIGLATVMLVLGMRVLLAIRYGHRLMSIVLHPVAVTILTLIAFNSWRWSSKGTIQWSGRTYASRPSRET